MIDQPGLFSDEPRKLTYWQDTVGAIATVLSVSAGLTKLVFWATDARGLSDAWMITWIVPLVWSGFIEVAAITAVYLTDSDTLRAIGGFSMVGVNTTSLVIIAWAQSVLASDAFIPTFALHGIALGQAIGTFIGTFILNGEGHFREYFNFYNCKESDTIFEGNCW